jgi:Uma2 family endonuclease
MYVAGNMFVYYSLEQARQVIAELEGTAKRRVAYRGPDVFVVQGVDATRERRSWVVWEEGGRYPDLIIELLSPSTARSDLTVKKDVYEKVFHTREYYCWDPFDPGALVGWRLSEEGVYEPLAPDDRGRLWSQVLKQWLGSWSGNIRGVEADWLRFFDQEGALVLTEAEAERQARIAAEQRVRALEAELARMQGKRRAGGKRPKQS